MYKNNILSIYPIHNFLQIDVLYYNYLKDILNDKNWSTKSQKYINNVEKYYYNYNTYIKKLKFDKYPINSTNANLLHFYKSFLSTIFKEISIKPYLCNSRDYIKKKSEIIYRPNHAALNHLRSLNFTNVLMLMLKREKKFIYNDLCPTKNHEFLLLISSLFKSILRNDEGGKCSQLIDISEKIIHTHFPNIAQYLTVFTPGMKISIFHLASGILLKSIIKYLDIKGINNEFIEMLVFGNIYYLDVKHNRKLTDYFNLKNSTAKNFEYKIGSPEHKILLIYCIICTGHYLDHCRLGNFGGILNQPHISILRKTIKTTLNDDQIIMHKVLTNLYYTEFYDGKNNLEIDIKQCLEPIGHQYDFYNHTSIKKSSDCCGRLSRKKYRYTNKFFEISKDFNKIYKELELELYFNHLLSI